jgi:beta-ureidopropionase
VTIRVALTQTLNAFREMPASVGALGSLQGRLREITRANVDHHLELVSEAARRGVRAICFGELFPAPYFALDKSPMWLALAEDAERGETITRLREGAAEHGLIIVAPIYELDPSGRRFNAAVLIDEDGRVIGKYRKAHIPNGQNEQGSFHESFYYDRSDGQNGSWPTNVSTNAFFPVFQTSVGRIGIAICYDRHFEGVVRTLVAQGAELLFSPAVTFGAKSERMWRLQPQGAGGAVEPGLLRRQPLRGPQRPVAKRERPSKSGHRGRRSR